MDVLYLCDLNKDCKDDIGCCRLGGECRHTTDVGHAKNEKPKFELSKDGTHYIEIEE